MPTIFTPRVASHTSSSPVCRSHCVATTWPVGKIYSKIIAAHQQQVMGWNDPALALVLRYGHNYCLNAGDYSTSTKKMSHK